MTWLIVIVALLIIIGPVMYLLPNRREKDQRSFRDAARAAGLTVELAQLYKIESEPHERVSAGGAIRVPKLPCARYGLPQAQPLSRFPEIHLVRGRTLPWQANPEYPSGGSGSGKLSLQAVIAPFLERLPTTSRGLSVTGSMLWLYWTEMPGEARNAPVSSEEASAEVEIIRDVLTALRVATADWHRGSVS
jgi:hypothetical protein